MKYKKVIRSDPKNTFLRIAYALFLSEYVKNRVQAMAQIEEGQSLRPNITEQFLLQRYKTIFESELAEEKMLVNKMAQSNIELAIKFEGLCNRFKNVLLDAASAFSELWGYMKNESATSFQLEKMINKIYDQGKIVEDTWEEILQIKGDIPKTLNLYAQYQLKVINDLKSSLILYKKAKTEEIIQAQAHQENELTLKDMRNITDYASDGTPCLYISAIPEKIGQIININMSACQLFGYPKQSLMYKNVKAIIPDIIGKHHNKSLLEAEKKEVSYFSKRRNFFTYGRQMTGYIIPLHLNVKKVLSFSSQGDQYGGLIYPVQSVAKTQEMHIMLDQRLNICELTENCVRILKLKKDVIKKQKVPIHLLIPSFPQIETLEKDVGGETEDYNTLIFSEKDREVFIPIISDNKRSESSSGIIGSSEGSHMEEDDSAFSNLRKNEVNELDSFIQHDSVVDLFNDEELLDDENDQDHYNIQTTDIKLQ